MFRMFADTAGPPKLWEMVYFPDTPAIAPLILPPRPWDKRAEEAERLE